MNNRLSTCFACLIFALGGWVANVEADWPQLQGNALRSGNAADQTIETPLRFIAALPATDAILAAPVVSGQQLFFVDGSGVVFAVDTQTMDVIWKFATRGGPGNCNNVAAPAVTGKFVHVGTMAGYYYVLDRQTGAVVKEIDCGEPVFAAPVVGTDRVYFATLGAKVYAVEPAGTVAWQAVPWLVCAPQRRGSLGPFFLAGVTVHFPQ